jgi:ubiquinol-cytochrome c reductase cytochrome b subunit
MKHAGMKRVRADHWSSLFGQIAIYSFMVLLVTGVFLTFCYVPDVARVRYGGSFVQLRGVRVSKAYESTLHISFDVRGGLLMRQMHHWAALTFIAAVCCLLVRLFLTGGYRRPRVPAWLAWVTLLVLAMAAGVTGTLLPDDMLSGGSLNLIQGVTQSIPVVGTRLSYLIFGGAFPGHDIIPRAYWLHITVLPVAVAVLLVRTGAFQRLRGRKVANAASAAAAAKATKVAAAAIALFTCGLLTMLGTFAQINPVWLFGPFEPGNITAGAVPGWYMGFLDGALRIMPGWEIDVAGHTLTLAVLVPALIVPGAFFTFLASYPWLERRITGDDHPHHVLDRPRDAATRSGICAAGIACYGLLWAAAANDQIAVDFHLSLFTVTWFFRIAVLAGPVPAFVLTRRLCLALVDREWDEAAHGYETGRIVMSPTGEFSEVHEPVGKELTMR